MFILLKIWLVIQNTYKNRSISKKCIEGIFTIIYNKLNYFGCYIITSKLIDPFIIMKQQRTLWLEEFIRLQYYVYKKRV